MRRLLFLWAGIIRGIPLIFVIFWLWYLLPMTHRQDLPGAVNVTVALAWFTSRVGDARGWRVCNRCPRAVQAALTQGFAPDRRALILLPQALRNVQPSLVGIFIGLLKDIVAGVYRQRAGTDHRRRAGQ